MAVTASFTSECAVCDGAIFEGDPIVNEDGDWVHEDCGPDDEDELAFKP